MNTLLILSIGILAVSIYLLIQELKKHMSLSAGRLRGRAIQSEGYAGMMTAYALPTLNVPQKKTAKQ
jgi:hypothetical protein